MAPEIARAAPLVSVIMPTYNRADYLKIAIDSVLAQTYINFELLILDNHSSDHTRQIISSYSDERITSVRHLANIGGLANWIYGMHWAKGEFFSVLGDDDFYRCNFLESRVKAFGCFANVDAIFSNYEICDELGIISSSMGLAEEDGLILTGKALLRVINEKMWQVGSTLFRRNPVVDFWDECIRAGKAFDTAVQVQIALRSAAAWIPGGGLVYRQHPQQDSRVSGKGILIGHVNAFAEPLIYEKYSRCRKELKNGVWWAIDILARTSLMNFEISVARNLFIFAVLLRPMHIRTWSRLFLALLPEWVLKKIAENLRRRSVKVLK